MSTARNIFISYNHKDVRYLERLRVHLKLLEQEGLIDPWDDTKIVPGTPWEASIYQAIDNAVLAIVLVSADLLASNFIMEYEIPRLMARAARNDLTILPIIVSPCGFHYSQLNTFQAINDPKRPLSMMGKNEKEKTLLHLAEVIKKHYLEKRGV